MTDEIFATETLAPSTAIDSRDWLPHNPAPTRRRARGALEILHQHPELRQDQEEYNINVTSNGGTMLSPEETFADFAAHEGAHKPAHLYFHVPLCNYICKFCNYVKRLTSSRDGEAELDRWTDLLLAESRMYLEMCEWLPAARVESVYLGGGTASLLQYRHLAKLMSHIQRRYAVTGDAEISLEGNPDNFLADEAARAVDLGFNRFSLGVQSLQDKVTQFSGRKHDARDSLQAIERLLETGKPFNVDMMFGLPHQTPDSASEDMRHLISMGVPTITIYRFRNALRHKMGIGNKSAWNNSKKVKEMKDLGLFPSLDVIYKMRERVVDELRDAGYTPSPCGWWSRPGTYPNGNIPQVSKNKWERFNTMVAYGPGAYGWVSGGQPGVVQTHNIQDIAAYMRHMEDPPLPPLGFGRKLSDREAVATALGFAFKANQPIDLKRFWTEYEVDLLGQEPYCGVITRLLDVGFLEWGAGNRWLLPTLDGETVHEEIISVYFHGAIGGREEVVCTR